MAADNGFAGLFVGFLLNNLPLVAFAVVVGVGFYFLRRYSSGGGGHQNGERLDGKTAIVTGANAGIGKETARALAAKGARVILACRDTSKAETAAKDIRETTGNGNVVVEELNLASLASVRKFAARIKKRETSLDVLINNAAVRACPKWVTEDGFERQFATNHLGHFLLTNLLLDLLKKSAPSRVVVVSAVLYKRGKIDFDDINSEKSYSPHGAYCQSKLANVLFMRELARRLEGTGVTANALHPGVVDTELSRNFSTTLGWIMLLLGPFFTAWVYLFAKTAKQGAETSVHLAVDKELETTSGVYFSDCKPNELAPVGKDDATATKLWQISEEMIEHDRTPFGFYDMWELCSPDFTTVWAGLYQPDRASDRPTAEGRRVIRSAEGLGPRPRAVRVKNPRAVPLVTTRAGTPVSNVIAAQVKGTTKMASNYFELTGNIVDFTRAHCTLVLSAVAGGIGLYFLRKYCAGGVCRSPARLDGKTVIITGANTGIGKETARDLAARGARVILACRDLNKAETAASEIRKSTGNGNVVIEQLDLASLASVRTFATIINEREPKVNILINNAGVAACPQWKTEDGFEMQFGTNHLGHFLLTNLLLDKLKNSAPSRVVIVSALAHVWGKIDFDDINSETSYSPIGSYCQSKLANVLFMRELARRLEGTGVTVNALHPGVMHTEIGRHFFTTFGWAALPMIPFVAVYYLFWKSVKQGAQTTIHLAVDRELETTSGLYFSDCLPCDVSPLAKDEATARRLWRLSEEMVGLKE
ncbi:Retinol dehydrogenase 12 [Branchiostoma belcheri]|nr:Retinol dehydrogenase 12 [Branchiostoma belcheri]